MVWCDSEVQDAIRKQGIDPCICNELDRLRSLICHLMEYQGQKLEPVLESEVVSHFVIPLLKALGWDEQHIKIELYSFEILCYKEPYRAQYSQNGTIDWQQTQKHNLNNAGLLLEVKAPFRENLINVRGPSCAVRDQLFRYASKIDNLPYAVATNGIYYFAYKRDQNRKFPDQPTANFNLIKRNHDLNRDIESLKYLSYRSADIP